jgi:hemolysin activation/secretion protein
MKKLALYQINLLCLSLLSSFFSAANAAPPQAPDAGLLMRETRDKPQLPQQKPEVNVEKTEPQRPQMPPQTNLQVTVKSFQFSGNKAFSQAQLEALLQEYKAKPLNFNELQKCTNRITDYYREQGYLIAQAYLPVQTIKDGLVEIAVLEGRLDSSHLSGDRIQLSGDTRINKSVLQRFLDRIQPDDTVTDSDINHLSLLINELPGIESTMVLSPGSEMGTSSLALKVREKPLLSGYVNTDNHGLYATGYYRFDGGLNINDPFGFGDQLSLRAQTTETGGSVMGAMDYTLPLNGYGTRLGINFSELHYSLGRSFQPLEAEGIARTVGASLIQTLYLTKEAKLTGTAHYEHRWLNDDVNAFDIFNRREIDLMSFAFAGSLFDTLLPFGGLTQAYLNVSAGSVQFTNRDAGLADQTSGLKSHGGYHKFYWQLNRTQNLWIDEWGDISVYANFSGQVASKNLDSSEQFSLGGPNAIRAYPVGEGNADEGWLFNGEVRYGLPRSAELPGQFQLIGFIDTGFSRINANPLQGDLNNSRHLTGYGFGINWLGLEGFNVRTSMAWRDVNAQPHSDPNQNEPQAYFQITKSF